MPKCARTACDNDNDNAVCIHSNSGWPYCAPCARKINEFAGRELVKFPIVIDKEISPAEFVERTKTLGGVK